MPLGQPLSPGFKISNFFEKLYINIYNIKKLEQSLQWLVRNSPDKILAILGSPWANVIKSDILNFKTLFTSISTISPNFRTIHPVVTENSSVQNFSGKKKRWKKNKKKNRGSYMSAHVLLNLLNELGKRDKLRGLPSILSLLRNEFNKFNNTRARMLDSIYHMT